jgi:hypothetical protein
MSFQVCRAYEELHLTLITLFPGQLDLTIAYYECHRHLVHHVPSLDHYKHRSSTAVAAIRQAFSRLSPSSPAIIVGTIYEAHHG